MSSMNKKKYCLNMFLLTSHYYMYIYLSCLLKLLYINTNVILKHVPHEPVTDVIFYGRLLKIATKSDTCTGTLSQIQYYCI